MGNSTATTITPISSLAKTPMLIRITLVCVSGSLAMRRHFSSMAGEMETTSGTINDPGMEKMDTLVLDVTLGPPGRLLMS